MFHYIRLLDARGEIFDYKKNEQLKRAVSGYLFESRKDKLKLNSTYGRNVDRHEQEKIEMFQKRLVDEFSYCNICSIDVLNYVASMLVRGR